MESRKLPNVTVGIVTYNNEQTIARLLGSILHQKGRFLLKKIIILSDGSTDQTDGVIRSYTALYPHITLVSDGRHLGKAQRLNQLFSMNTNEFLLLVDPDVVLADDEVIVGLLHKFSDDRVVMVGGNITPMYIKTTVERYIATWHELCYEIQKDIHFGHTIYNVYGKIMALRYDFVSSVVFPEDMNEEAYFLYFTLKQQGLKFKFAKDATVFYELPATGNAHAARHTSTILEMKKNAERFGEWIYIDTPITRKHKLQGFFQMFIQKPRLTVLAILFHWWVTRGSEKVTLKQSRIFETPSPRRRMRLGGL